MDTQTDNLKTYIDPAHIKNEIISPHNNSFRQTDHEYDDDIANNINTKLTNSR